MAGRVCGWIVRRIPFAGSVIRITRALVDACMPTKRTYAQFGEDVAILCELQEWPFQKSLYVDVGANHPSRLSNTYRLYRMGWRGITVDPNIELIRLHQLFRPGDIQVNVGCGRGATLLPFYFDTAPVLSSFKRDSVNNLAKSKYMPILTVDQILESFKDKTIALLSIDTEGLDVEVLMGSSDTLDRTYLVCVESNTNTEQDKTYNILTEKGFMVLGQYGCNRLFRNCNLKMINPCNTAEAI